MIEERETNESESSFDQVEETVFDELSDKDDDDDDDESWDDANTVDQGERSVDV